ncbi:hypothetical protein I8J29_30455 [Paenibacillus sp. MWE-103]|uniref:Uncharacterized protein n=1 Tax=Paenibacillus artemisiicola TaxID=1172618 RepID=A0ABS3WJK7_9BACL|nr:hypothetical protein [Paenibacillus artemisiicola]MBO7748505.1 hypothetical protein [Paenibacillus artemisiicola]
MEIRIVPELEAYVGPEETAPSVHFASLVLNELYLAAKAHVLAFLRQVDAARVPVSARCARTMAGSLRQGLLLAGECLEKERRLFAPSAERLAADPESWYA